MGVEAYPPSAVILATDPSGSSIPVEADTDGSLEVSSEELQEIVSQILMELRRLNFQATFVTNLQIDDDIIAPENGE